MKKSGLLLVGLIMQTCLYAQFNDSTHYLVGYTSTGIINRTENNKSYLLSNALRFTLNRQYVSLNVASSYVYGQQQDTKTNNDFSSTLDFDLYKNIHRLYYWGLANYDKSYSLKINDRLQAGAGLAFRFLKNESANILVSDGLLYENSDLVDANGKRDAYQTVRNSLRVKYHWVVTDFIILDGTNFLQNSLADKKDYLLKSNTTLSLKLRKWLNVTTALQYNKITRTGRENLLLTFGLAAEKYF